MFSFIFLQLKLEAIQNSKIDPGYGDSHLYYCLSSGKLNAAALYLPAMKAFSQWLKDYFDLNRGERRGLAVLTCILLLLVIVYYLTPYFFKPQREDFTEIQKLSVQLQEAQSDEEDTTAKLFAFDPNTSPKDTLVKLGIKPRVASMIVNYGKRGERFNTKEDLLKIKGVSRETYMRLAPWIVIVK